MLLTPIRVQASFFTTAAVAGVLLTGILAGCSPKKAEDKTAAVAPSVTAPAVPPTPDSTAAAPAAAPDSANLSPQFVRGLRELTGSEQYRVRGKWLVLNRQDSVQFPTELPAGRPVIYTGLRGDQTVTLTVTRRNYTSLEFVAEIAGGQKQPLRTEGVAELNPGFYLGAEAPEDDKSQTAFGAAEFAGTTPQGHFSVQVGLAKDVDKATLYAYDATGKPLPKWQGIPTLRRLML